MILIQAVFKMAVRMVDVGRFRRLIHSHSRRSVRDFIKTGVTGKYYLNYPAEGGLQCRFFAGKFIYTKRFR
jgi:hypothetical protein